MKNFDENFENKFLDGDQIIGLAIKETEKNYENGDVKEAERVSLNEARNVMEIALKYDEQQGD